MSVIPALRRLMKGDQVFKTSLGYTAKQKNPPFTLVIGTKKILFLRCLF
jgi:hypothetical protein